MSWTTVRGHRPVGPRVYERPLGDQDPALDQIAQTCSCGERYDWEHVTAQLID